MGEGRLKGRVALVTGAASGIGKACVASLLARGAAVVGLDRDPAIETLHARSEYRGIVCDAWKNDPSSFKINPHHLIPGPNT